jgi:predicted phosphate transport protein (TIGR00153 family)
VRLSLRRQETSFFDLFSAAGENLRVGADLLAEMVPGDDARRRELAGAIRDCEHVGDEITHQILRQLNQTFVTPFDREDIYRLASRLDDVIDFMEAAADLIVLYDIGELPDGVGHQAEVLGQAARLTAAAMPRLRAMKDLAQYWVEANRLENEADRIYRRLVAHLFGGGYPALDVLKLKEVIDQLEGAADAFEKVADTVESIAVKES